MFQSSKYRHTCKQEIKVNVCQNYFFITLMTWWRTDLLFIISKICIGCYSSFISHANIHVHVWAKARENLIYNYKSGKVLFKLLYYAHFYMMVFENNELTKLISTFLFSDNHITIFIQQSQSCNIHSNVQNNAISGFCRVYKLYYKTI